MIRDPLDIDRFWPEVMSRDAALDALQNFLTEQEADWVWNRLLGPLYDLRRAMHQWPRGKCPCGATHPALRAGPGRKADDHRMGCEKYVGPLDHYVMHHGGNLVGPWILCSCGKRYSPLKAPDGGVYDLCPDRMRKWRGPRPSSPEESRMTEQNPQQSETEEARLARLKASGQLPDDATTDDLPDDGSGEQADEQGKDGESFNR